LGIFPKNESIFGDFHKTRISQNIGRVMTYNARLERRGYIVPGRDMITNQIIYVPQRMEVFKRVCIKWVWQELEVSDRGRINSDKIKWGVQI